MHWPPRLRDTVGRGGAPEPQVGAAISCKLTDKTQAALAVCIALVLAGVPVVAQDIPEAVRATLEEADRQRAAGRHEEAKAGYQQALKQLPTLAAAYVGLGAIEVAAKKPEEALRVFAEGLKHVPDDRTLLFNAGATALQLGRPKEALNYVERALARNDKDAALRGLKGSILQRLDRTEEAIAELQGVVRLDASNARAHFNLGNALFRVGKKTEAIEAFERAVREDKTFTAAYYNLGAALFEAKRYDEALKAYDVALAPIEKDLAAQRPVDAAHARAYLNLGGLYSQRQSWDRALDAYKKAEKLDPAIAAAAYNIGYILYRMDRLDEAYEAYTRASQKDASLPLANLHRGLIDEKRGRMESAVRLLELALPSVDEAERRLALVAQARAYHAQKDVDKARERYEKVLVAHPDEVEALVGLGRLLRETGKIAEARTRLEQARKVVLESTGVALELAALAKVQGDRAQEKALYGEVLKREGARPEMWPVRLSLALLLADEGATPAARQEIELLTKKPEALPSADARKLVRTAYATLLAKEGDLPGATREFTAALQDDSAFAPARVGLAVLTALGGNLNGASSALSPLVSGKDYLDVRRLARVNLGKVLWAMGRGAEAKAHLEAAADEFPQDVSAQAALGELALAAGDRATAIRRLSTALETCEPSAGSAAASDKRKPGFLGVTVGADPTKWLCPRVKQVLAQALLQGAVETLERGRGDVAAREARDAADRVLTLAAAGPAHGAALFVKGTALLLLDDVRGARRDLAVAVGGGELPTSLLALAHNNLGAALYRDGAAREAQPHFETARSLKAALAPAALNLAMVLESSPEAQPKALALFDEYLALGGSRRDEAQKRAETLRRVYQ